MNYISVGLYLTGRFEAVTSDCRVMGLSRTGGSNFHIHASESKLSLLSLRNAANQVPVRSEH